MSELFYEEDLAWHKATVKAMERTMMNVTYKFNSLNELADHFAEMARRRREMITARSLNSKPKSVELAQLRAEAAAYESAAHIARNTLIKEPLE